MARIEGSLRRRDYTCRSSNKFQKLGLAAAIFSGDDRKFRNTDPLEG